MTWRFFFFFFLFRSVATHKSAQTFVIILHRKNYQKCLFVFARTRRTSFRVKFLISSPYYPQNFFFPCLTREKIWSKEKKQVFQSYRLYAKEKEGGGDRSRKRKICEREKRLGTYTCIYIYSPWEESSRWWGALSRDVSLILREDHYIAN